MAWFRRSVTQSSGQEGKYDWENLQQKRKFGNQRQLVTLRDSCHYMKKAVMETWFIAAHWEAARTFHIKQVLVIKYSMSIPIRLTFNITNQNKDCKHQPTSIPHVNTYYQEKTAVKVASPWLCFSCFTLTGVFSSSSQRFWDGGTDWGFTFNFEGNQLSWVELFWDNLKRGGVAPWLCHKSHQ